MVSDNQTLLDLYVDSCARSTQPVTGSRPGRSSHYAKTAKEERGAYHYSEPAVPSALLRLYHRRWDAIYIPICSIRCPYDKTRTNHGKLMTFCRSGKLVKTEVIDADIHVFRLS